MALSQSFAVQQTQNQRQTLAQWMAMRQSPILEMSQEKLLERQLEELRTNPVVERVELPLPVDSSEEIRAEENARAKGPMFDEGGAVPPPASPDVPADVLHGDEAGAQPGSNPGLVLGAEGDSLSGDDVDDFFVNGGNNEYTPEDEERYQYKLDSITSDESLEEHLMRQLAASDLSEKAAALAQGIVQSLDANGYLASSLADIAQSCGATLAEAKRALSVVQEFDPPGIAACNLAERFLLQLEAEGLDDVLAADLLRAKPDAFRPRDFRVPSLVSTFQCSEQDIDALAAAGRCTRADVLLALEDLKGLDPSPADRFIPRDQDVVATDATVVERNGRFVVLGRETPDDAPADDGVLFRVNPEFQTLSDDPKMDPAFRDELKRKIGEAEDLAKHVRGRNGIVLDVAAAIVARQQGFFANRSLAALQPMTQKDIAADLSSGDRTLDESQVSRACNGKWMKTPFGNLMFNDLFSRGVSGVSNRSVKDRVRHIIDEEDKTRPLSDMEVSRKLAAEGITLSREGVKKYRNEFHIPSSTQRKRV